MHPIEFGRLYARNTYSKLTMADMVCLQEMLQDRDFAAQCAVAVYSAMCFLCGGE
jgi:hypothetical protein